MARSLIAQRQVCDSLEMAAAKHRVEIAELKKKLQDEQVRLQAGATVLLHSRTRPARGTHDISLLYPRPLVPPRLLA